MMDEPEYTDYASYIVGGYVPATGASVVMWWQQLRMYQDHAYRDRFIARMLNARSRCRPAIFWWGGWN